MKILIISHQLDFSGAPIALLQLTQALKEQGHEITLASFASGPLGGGFLALGVKPYQASAAIQYDLYIANTSLTVSAALEVAPSPEAVLAWIHESRHLFDVSGVHPDSLSLNQLRYAAFPSRFQIDEFAKWMPHTKRMQLRNHVWMPEPSEPTGNEKYYVCTGKWEANKNQSRLLELLRSLPAEPTIYFVGANRPLEMGMTAPHRFLGEIPLDQSKLRISQSRGLISSAIAETQNLSAIEAMMAERPVLLSDIPAHRELKESIPDILLFDPNSVDSFTRGFQALQEQWNDVALRKRLQTDANNAFGKESFLRGIELLFEQMNMMNVKSKLGVAPFCS